MKKSLSLLFAAALLGLAACNKQELVPELGSGEQISFDLSLDLPDNLRSVTSAPTTKVGGGTGGQYVSSALGGLTNLRVYNNSSSQVTTYATLKWTVDIYYGHYDDEAAVTNAANNTNFAHPYHWEVEQADNVNFAKTIKLAKGEPYTIIAKAEFAGTHQNFNDEAEDYYYKVHKFFAVTNTGSHTYKWNGTDQSVTITDNNKLGSINGLALKRPHGKLRVIADDYATFKAIEVNKGTNRDIKAIDVEYTKYEGQTGTSTKFSTGTTDNPLKTWPGFAGADNGWDGDGGDENCSNGKTLFIDYLNGGSDFATNATLYQMNITVYFTDYDASTNPDAKKEITINQDVPIKVNALTTIRGYLLCESENVDLSITVDDDFESGINGHHDINI